MSEHRDFEKDPMYIESSYQCQPLDVNCPKCKTYLTTMLISDRCEQTFSIKCRKCGSISQGSNLWAEKIAKVEDRDH